MSKFSVRAYLEERHQIKVSKGRKITCPFCGHETMGVKGDTLAKCFHTSCGRFINARTVQSDREHLQQFLWAFMTAAHMSLMTQTEAPEQFGNAAYRYLTEERRIHPRVVMESPVLGVVPADFPFDTVCSEFRQRLQAEADPKEQAESLATFDRQSNEMRQQLEKVRGWLVFGYTDHTQRLISFKFREPFTRHFSQFKPFETAGVFNPFLFETDETLPWSYLVLTEGEFNILSLQSLLVNNELGYCRALAIGSASSVDWSTLKQFREHWLLFQDNDEAGDALVMVMQAHRTFCLTRSAIPNEDLDAFIHRFQTSAEAFEAVRKAIRDAQTRFRLVDAIADDIQELRRNRKPKLPAFEINQKIGRLLTEELQERGHFYRTPLAPYFLDRDNGKLYLLNKTDKATQRYLHGFRLNPTENVHGFVLSELERVAHVQGQSTQTFQFVHYDRASHRVYLFNRDSEVFRISAESIDVVANGTDGLLFESLPGYQPFKRLDVGLEEDLLSSLLVTRVNFDDGALTLDEYRMLLEVWVYSLFFDGLHATRPIASFIGPKGSSKTSTLRRLGILLFGPAFQVSPMPEKADDFDASVTNGFLVGYDNVDGQTAWLNDKLAIAATGGNIKRRELYSTNNLVEFPIRAHVAITSRTPKFRRDDVSERLLIFPMKVLERKISEQFLLDEVQSERDRFMSWLLLRLQEILRMLTKTEGQPAVQTQLRMADFATFLLRLAKADELEEEALDLIERLAIAQSQFTLEQDPLFTLLEIVAVESPGLPFNTAALHQELIRLAAKAGIRYNYKSANSLGQKLGHLKNNLAQMLDIRIEDGNGNTRLYSFRPKSPNALTSLTLNGNSISKGIPSHFVKS